MTAEQNPNDPNKDPFAYLNWEMGANRRAFLNKNPEQRNMKPWQAASFAAQNNQQKPRRKMR